MSRRPFAGLVLAAVVGAGCTEPAAPGPTPGGLAVDSTRPANNAMDVPFVGPALVYFDRPLAGASVSGLTAGILLPGNQATPGRVAYDAARRAIRMDLALIPGVTYQGLVTTGVRGEGGESLPADHQWTFRTRTPATGTVDPGADRGRSPSVAVDGAGAAHAAYVDGGSGAVLYARCPADCTASGSWTVVTIGGGAPADSRIDLAVGPGGEVAVAHYRTAEGALIVSTCAAGCGAAGGWRSAVVDDAAGDVGFSPALARGADGALHVVAQDRGATAVRYSRCRAACDTPAGWSAPVQLQGTSREGRVSDVVVAPDGRLHAMWVDDNGSYLIYASCGAGCTAASGWSVTPLTATVDAVDRLALALDPAGLPLVLFGIDDFVAAGLCVAPGCDDNLNWSFLGLLLDAAPGSPFSIAADTAGRFHGVYASESGAVRYVTCSSLCETSARRWVGGDLTAAVGAAEAGVAIAPTGEPVALYRRSGQGVAFAR